MKWKILVNAIALSICLLMSWRWANAQALREALARHHRLHAPQDPGTSTTTKWTLLFPTQIPDERFAASAAYDIATNSLLVFAGANFSTIRNDLLSLSNANGLGTSEWTTVIPDGAAGSPSGRTFHTAVYDENSSRMVVFGGCSFTGQLCTTLLNDVWVLSNANGVGGTPTWSQISPAGAGPAPRWGHAAAYDFANNRMIIYGGEDDSQIFSDVWVLSNANSLGGTPTWTQLSIRSIAGRTRFGFYRLRPDKQSPDSVCGHHARRRHRCELGLGSLQCKRPGRSSHVEEHIAQRRERGSAKARRTRCVLRRRQQSPRDLRGKRQQSHWFSAVQRCLGVS